MEDTIFYPMVAQGALIFSVFFVLLVRRMKAIFAGQSDMKYFLVFDGSGEPQKVTQAQRSFINQFEMPVLFFVVCLMASVFGKVDQMLVYAAWTYVGLRTLHALVHVTKNDVRARFSLFMLSNIALLFMWVWVALQ